jgi:hypothetical protein
MAKLTAENEQLRKVIGQKKDELRAAETANGKSKLTRWLCVQKCHPVVLCRATTTIVLLACVLVGHVALVQYHAGVACFMSRLLTRLCITIFPLL